MRIDRDKVRQRFADYTAAYDASDEKIRLKIEHTYRVADLCGQIAETRKLTQEEVDLAWLLGMLHDVGRFEQLRQYGTFSDAQSVDHARLGADILFSGDLTAEINTDAEGETHILRKERSGQENEIRAYLEDSSEDELIETAIRVHSAYRIPENLGQRTALFCHILRDADKIDILRVNIEVPPEEIYNVTTAELKLSTVSEEVMQAFGERHAILRTLKRSAVDHLVGHIALVFELVFPISIQLVRQQGYLEQLLNFRSENPRTLQQFDFLRAQMEEYLQTIETDAQGFRTCAEEDQE